MNFGLILSPFAHPYFLLGLIALFMLARIRKQKRSDISIWLLWLIAATAFWLFTQALEYISLDLKTKIFWDNFQWLGITFVPATFLLLTFDLAGWRKWIKPFSIIILGILPAIILGFVYTNEYHHLFVSKYSLIELNDYVGLDKEYTRVFWVFFVYAYSLIGLGIIALVWINLHSPDYYRNQVRLVIIAACATAATYLFDLSDFNPFPFIQFGSLVLAVFMLITAGSLSRLRQKDLRYASQSLILNAISDPFLLLDTDYRILEHNASAGDLLGHTGKSLINQTFRNASPDLYAQFALLISKMTDNVSTVVTLPGNFSTYQARISVVKDSRNNQFGYLLSFVPIVDATQLTSDLQRSLSLTEALSKVAARAASVSSPAAVLETMGDELRKLDIHCAYMSVDPLKKFSAIRYVSYGSKIIESIDKLLGINLIGFKFPHSLWPQSSKKAIVDNYPVFVRDLLDDIIGVFPDFSEMVFKSALQVAGISQRSNGIYIPTGYSDGSTGFIIVWGESLSEKDLPAFSIFGSQVGSTFQQARYLQVEKRQSQELENSNALIQALSQVALRTAATIKPVDVLKNLGEELKKLGLRYSLFRVENDLSFATVEFVSPDVKIIRGLEKIGRIAATDFRMMKSEWSSLASQAIETKSPIFVSSFMKEISVLFRKYGSTAIGRAVKLIGVNEKTMAYYFPLFSEDREIRILTIWGNTLREEDLPIFSIFANQVSSAFESARLYSSERKQAEELKRSQSLIASLSGVAARISSNSDPDRVMESMGMELKKFGVDCLVTLLDSETDEAYVRFHSMETKFMRMAEKVTGRVFTDQRLPLQKWPALIVDVFKSGLPVYSENFLENTMTFMPRVSRRVARRALGYVGVDESTTGYFLPLELQGNIFGCLSIWGMALRQGDLPAFSVFANQVAGAFENARLYNVEHEQANRLERSNALQRALSQVAVSLSSATTIIEILDVTRNELSTLGLEFTFTSMDSSHQMATIEYISLAAPILDQIKKVSGISLIGNKMPNAIWPEEGLEIYEGNQPRFHTSFSETIWPLFRKVGKGIYKQGLKFSGISEKTSCIILPLSLVGGKVGFLAVWGNSLRERDTAAFTVFVRQVESRLEAIHLFNQAEKEITERRLAQKALLESREEYRGLFENAHDAIMIFDPNTLQVLSTNEQACEMYGYSQEEFVGIKLSTISQDVNLLTKKIKDNFKSGKRFTFETIQTRKDGRQMNLEINASLVNFQGIKAIQSINRDVTSRKHYEEKLSHDAFHDRLTDLPNRALFLDRLGHVMARDARNKTISFAILFLDMDRFKDVNDSLGHTAGDQFLITVAGRLKNSIRGMDTVARLGGDEFVILLESIKSIHEVTESSKRILNQLSRPVILEGNEIVVSGSIGIVISNSDYSKPEEYLRDADIAMYRAKEQGKSRYEIFDDSMRIAVIERLELEAKLRRAIINQEFVVFYQPIIDMYTNQIAGFEALIRWQLSDGRIVSPAEFIPIAEETGMIHQIGNWILTEACLQQKIWHYEYKVDDPLTISVNVSGLQLMTADFTNEVERVIQETGVDPNNLILEITESSLIKDQKTATEKIRSLKTLGVRIHLDDFGTGYSSLSFLAQFPIDAIKIDRKFVANIDRKNQADLVDVITALGNKLNLKVVAEGIETEEQLAFLKEIDCQYGQGYYFSKPVDAPKISKLLFERESSSSNAFK